MAETLNTRTLAQLLDQLGMLATNLRATATTLRQVNGENGDAHITNETIEGRMNEILAIKDKLNGLIDEQDIPLITMSRAEHLKERALDEEKED
jgi:glutamine synthetase type III